MLLGCGSGAANETGNATTAGTTAAAVASTTAAAAPAEDGPLSKYPETVTVHMVHDQNQADDWKLQALKSIGETMEDNRYTRQLMDKLNIKVVYDWIVDSAQFNQKIKMTIASGSLPDVMKVQLPDLDQLTQSDMITDLTPYFDKYATDFTKKLDTEDGGMIMNAITFDGKMMGIPQPTASTYLNEYLWLRTDWLTKLKMAPPKNMDEFLALMKAFVENDPDGNGKKDTFAMIISKPEQDTSGYTDTGGIWQAAAGFFACFDAYPTSWIKDASGNIVYGSTQPAMKDVLRVLQKMYKDGWLDPEFTVKDFNKAKEIVAAGKCGVEFGYHWMANDPLKPSHENVGADWGVYESPSATGNIVKYARHIIGLRSTLVVRKGYEHPEAIIKMMNLYNEDNFGENNQYDVYSQPTINGKLVNDIWYLGPIDSLYDGIDVIQIDEIQPVFAGTKSADSLSSNSKVYYNNCLNDWGWMKMFGPEKELSSGSFYSRAAHDPAKYAVTNEFYGAPTPTMLERWVQLSELRDTVVTKIITGQLDVDSGFDNFVADWNKSGGDKVTTEVNEWYKAHVK